LQTTLTPAQETIAVALRTTLLVSLDDLLAVVHEFLNPNVSRSGLDRCLRRHGVGNLRDLTAKAAKPKHSAFKAYEPGLYPRRREIPATNGRLEPPPLSLRGNRSANTVGVHPHLPSQDRG
jgi:hypothetical protein